MKIKTNITHPYPSQEGNHGYSEKSPLGIACAEVSVGWGGLRKM